MSVAKISAERDNRTVSAFLKQKCQKILNSETVKDGHYLC